MPISPWRGVLAALALIGLGQGLGPVARGDAVRITLKNGTVYQGDRGRDNTIVSIFDELKRVVINNAKIDRIESEAGNHNLERFRLVQPIEVHGGAMPEVAIEVRSTPWDPFGRRSFSYKVPGARRPVAMTQAINELGPQIVRLRGVTGFWQGLLSTSQVPKPVVLGLLARVERTDQNERLRICRFLIQAEWYPEAKAELEGLAKDFPDLEETAQNVLRSVQDLEARQVLAEIAQRRRAQQPRDVIALLKAFPVDGVPSDLLTEVRDQLRRDEGQAVADRALADAIRGLADRLPSDARKSWNTPLVEVLRGLSEAPDAARPRLDAYQKASADRGSNSEALFALAMSGWAVGPEGAVTDLTAAKVLWEARGAVRAYLSSHSEDDRVNALATLEALQLPDPGTQSPRKLDLETVTRLALKLPPPLADDADAPGKPKTYRVIDDPNPVPTEYAVLLPPEYHPSRVYPAVVALHAGNGPRAAIDWWAAEANRRGYIVIAPEYQLPDREPEYRYSCSEHAAVELALRDARKRFSIDGNRVYLGGQLLGGNMAWDFGLAHPDLFAGVAIISGLPEKYVFRTKAHADRLPLYIVIGDLAPAANEIVFELARSLIVRSNDVTYVEYYKRGLEDLPEEAPAVFDWMERRRRDPYPKSFNVLAARPCDDRFFGVVIREFAAGRTTTPEGADSLGKNLKPATINLKALVLANRVDVRADGVKRLDVWVGPKSVDFRKKVEVRINGKPYYKDVMKPDFEPFLEDLRVRGDREQVYWLKVSTS